jgi:hypothetical protein
MYALGVNIALQVGGELKGVLTPEELKQMIVGFSDSINDKVEDHRALLTKYGPMINEVLQSRAHVVVDKEKKSGLEFVTKYLHENPTAVNTASGLVYHETVAGMGKQVRTASVCSVMLHRWSLVGCL